MGSSGLITWSRGCILERFARVRVASDLRSASGPSIDLGFGVWGSGVVWGGCGVWGKGLGFRLFRLFRLFRPSMALGGCRALVF